MNAKKTAPLSWRWVWICSAVAIVCYFGIGREVGFVLLIGTAALAIIAAMSHFIREIADERERPANALKPESEAEEFQFALGLPHPGEDGWDGCTITPSKNTYEHEFCGGGLFPPTDRSTYEYVIKDDQVFNRLVEKHTDAIYGTHYEVINGQVLEGDIRKRKSAEFAEKLIERLKADVLWHQLTGSLRYFILSKHGCQRWFFSAERERLQEGFGALEKAASGLRATRKPGDWYEPPADADEQTRTALEKLQQDASLMGFKICFNELQDYEHIVQTLDALASESQQS
jgi:hypothetical protein